MTEKWTYSKAGEAHSTRVLVTGASGFIGRAIFQRLVADGEDVIGSSRKQSDARFSVPSPQLDACTDWRPVLSERSVVVHVAGRAHISKEVDEHSLERFRKVNTEGTRQLACQAAEMGIGRFVFLSSIGVNGQTSTCPFKETDVPVPSEPYAISKMEAEYALMEVSQRTGMEVVIIRPPLVYGYNAPGNFGRLINAIKRRVPLPLGAVKYNRRTLVGLDNLVDLIVTCIHHPAAANEIFLAGDSQDLSTVTLLRKLAAAFEVSTCLIPVPVPMLKAVGAALGKRDVIDRLCGSLQVDISKAQRLLGWSPPVSVDAGMRITSGRPY